MANIPTGPSSRRAIRGVRVPNTRVREPARAPRCGVRGFGPVDVVQSGMVTDGRHEMAPNRSDAPRGMNRDEFASLVSHELRNPLNAASGWLHLLSADTGLRSDQAQRAVAGLRRALEQQLTQIDTLAGVLRLAGGEHPAGAVAVHLGAVLAETAEVLAEAARSASRVVRVDTVQGAPDRIVGDRAMLVAALSALGGFALRHGARGAPLRLTLDGQDGVPRVVLAIDEGDDGGLSIWQGFAREGGRLPLELLHAVLALEAHGARVGPGSAGRVPDALHVRFVPPIRAVSAGPGAGSSARSGA